MFSSTFLNVCIATDELVKSGIKADIVNLEGGFAAWENQNGNSGTKTY